MRPRQSTPSHHGARRPIPLWASCAQSPVTHHSWRIHAYRTNSRPITKTTKAAPHPDPAGEPRDALAHFRSRLATGDYHAVLGRGLRTTLRAAASDTGLDTEIGALRLALARLLQEETDPSRMATGVARLAGVAMQAARLRTDPDAGLDEIRSVFLRELAVLDAEHLQRTERDHEGYRHDAIE